jgi:hypothetical protein
VLAVPGDTVQKARVAMAATTNFVAEELHLELRVGMLPVASIRAAGHDMRVARYAASKEAVYAMFSGGGASYTEHELKAGRIAIGPAPPGSRPDLTGLSCRWSPITSRLGVILSILVAPAPGASEDAFRRVASRVIRITEAEARGGHPVPAEGPQFALNGRAMQLEAAASTRAGGSRLRRIATILGEMLFAIYLDKTGGAAGRFDPKRYRGWVARNSDFRKYDDALRMTIDCSIATSDLLEAVLREAEVERVVDYGLHRQDAALMTCIVPSYVSDDHVHFLDGAGGGYTLAAQVLKGKLAARMPAPAELRA